MEKKVMYDYTLFCTPEQTKKALELGAPIIEIPFSITMSQDICDKYGLLYLIDKYYQIPTAEQMIGWLESAFDLRLFCGEDAEGKIFFNVYNPQECISEIDGHDTRKEATLAAIDAALEHLSKKIKED